VHAAVFLLCQQSLDPNSNAFCKLSTGNKSSNDRNADQTQMPYSLGACVLNGEIKLSVKYCVIQRLSIKVRFCHTRSAHANQAQLRKLS